ncbi:hypothetical protein BSQ39_09795 [Loigolactobacillus backii]|uniref:hypothetical protein n=1 Tax=Loigolactobacillus backii TaxID=375175 RepID=UPI000C1CA2C6|nr:hypothetical protein [Loigolactobacillus backii]PIO83841.1 hypothetical protein BSQ39_09795 [Loigolactobacillus backii]
MNKLRSVFVLMETMFALFLITLGIISFGESFQQFQRQVNLEQAKVGQAKLIYESSQVKLAKTILVDDRR